jgi:hypothetical protein
MTDWFYVSIVRGKRSRLLKGPYTTHDEALANVDEARDLAVKRDPFHEFDWFGTCRINSDFPSISIFGP